MELCESRANIHECRGDRVPFENLFPSEHTGIPWYLEPLNHLLPLWVVGKGRV